MENTQNRMYTFENQASTNHPYPMNTVNVPQSVPLFVNKTEGDIKGSKPTWTQYSEQLPINSNQWPPQFIREDNKETAYFEQNGTYRGSNVYPIPRPMYPSPTSCNFMGGKVLGCFDHQGMENQPYPHDPRIISRGPLYPDSHPYFPTPDSHYNQGPYPKMKRGYEITLLPGETNPDAIQGEHLCFDFLKSGKCSRNISGKVCRYRHLVPIHPDAIACKYRLGLLTAEEITRYALRPCEDEEVNPFAPIDAPLCKDFLNHRVCERTRNMKICRYRHCLPHHPLAIEDKNRRKREYQSKVVQKHKKAAL